ncbi:F-box/LRR-repeat protein At3g48880 [Eutrema salsugineum]|nr:F-box/LRR-repeat protein At3g48880 [Eutrema salsugineum]
MAKDRKNMFRGWENLDTDILVMIFKKYLSLDELTSGVAHVCRGWRVACCDPILWNTLDLSHMRTKFLKVSCMPCWYLVGHSDKEVTRILKLSMSLSKRNTKTLIFHYDLFPNDDMITYTTRRCPNLRRLVLPSWDRLEERGICDAISFCKKLESLTMPSMPNPHFVFSAIRENCKKFRELKVMGPIDLFFVQNLVCLLPKLKVLSLRCTSIRIDALTKILDKMKRLEVLNVSHSYIEVSDTEVTEVPWSTVIEKAFKLKQFVACKDPKTCVKCQWTEKDEGVMRWNMYDERLWKEDEISSLHL